MLCQDEENDEAAEVVPDEDTSAADPADGDASTSGGAVDGSQMVTRSRKPLFFLSYRDLPTFSGCGEKRRWRDVQTDKHMLIAHRRPYHDKCVYIILG